MDDASNFPNNDLMITKSVLEWYESWQLWQRNIFLSSVLSSFAVRRLRGLESAVESVFHKDFLINYNGDLVNKSLQNKRNSESSNYSSFESFNLESLGLKDCGNLSQTALPKYISTVVFFVVVYFNIQYIVVDI